MRHRKCVPETQHLHTRQMVGVIQPGESVALPWAGSDTKGDMCVQVRPQSDSSQYSWGRAISDFIAQTMNNEGTSAMSPRQTKSNIPVSALPLKELEKTEEILWTKITHGGGSSHGLCWLNVDVDATVLYDEVNVPVPDWRITVNAPVKLENRLPCSAAYILYEKPRASGNLIKQQDGIVSAGGSVYIYSVDVRRPIYLTWLAQGGWRSEKEVVSISDPSMEDLPTGFWMAHQGSGRYVENVDFYRFLYLQSMGPRT
jgi:vacuolar protein sorting-associated protein 13A/C